MMTWWWWWLSTVGKDGDSENEHLMMMSFDKGRSSDNSFIVLFRKMILFQFPSSPGGGPLARSKFWSHCTENSSKELSLLRILVNLSNPLNWQLTNDTASSIYEQESEAELKRCFSFTDLHSTITIICKFLKTKLSPLSSGPCHLATVLRLTLSRVQQLINLEKFDSNSLKLFQKLFQTFDHHNHWTLGNCCRNYLKLLKILRGFEQ